MIGRGISGSLALACAAALAGCGAETPEACVERFTLSLAGHQPTGGAMRGYARWQPVFTYDVSRMDNVLEELVGRTPEERAGLRMTLAGGNARAAIGAFLAADVPPKGAILAADDVTLFRTAGAPGSREATLVAGCRGAPQGARLVHVLWRPLPPEPDAAARS